MTNKILHGDCLIKLKELEDNSVDSIVTDPPYELGFMGKSWDNTGIANNPLMWAECLRVLKPGGHLLAFSGTRTYHRMASAIEDAGFEVRDMIEWVYGCLSEDTEILTKDGWKMLYSIFEGDYVFACDYINDMKLQLEPVKQKFIYDYDEDAYHIKDTGYYNSELMETDHIVSKNHNVLVSESWARDCFSNGEYPQKVAAEVLYKNVQKRKELGYKSDFHIPGLNCFIPCTIEKMHYKGKVWCVEVESGAFVARRNGKIFITGNSGFPKSLNIGKAVDKLQGNEREVVGIQTNIANKGNNNDGRYNWNTENQERKESIDITKGTSEWEGWGTALKPAHEPICMARKPLAEKTVAENCLKWGVGGINIDESRVEAQKGDKFGGGGLNSPVNGFMGNTENTYKKGTGFRDDTALGRFPANLIHDNSEEVRECFPESKGAGGSIPDVKTTGFGEFGKGSSEYTPDNRTQFDSGSGNASRFFKSIIYQAKASKSERNKGLEDFEEVEVRGGGGRVEDGYDLSDPDQVNLRRAATAYGAVKAKKANIHPTVKPIALMEYLIKMVTPKGGVVLDPFAGSGSTLVAAKENGFNYIGIELTEEYIPIIEARLKDINYKLL